MQVFREYYEVKEFKPYCIALGSFDGIHIGHQKIIKELVNKSTQYNANSLVYTFFEHPKKVLDPKFNINLITKNEKRIQIFNNIGVHTLFLEDFNKIVKLSPQEFVKYILIDKFDVKCVMIGYNYHFGYKSEGDADRLVKFGKEYGFDTFVVQPITKDNSVISSSLIRKLIVNGEVDKVYNYLGRYYSLIGKVIRGKQNGGIIGFKTANLQIESDFVIPKPGVYISDTLVDGKMYKSVTNIGYNPTFNSQELSIESHIIDFNSELYNKKIEVFFMKWIRDDMKFENIEQLRIQIKSDILKRLDYK